MGRKVKDFSTGNDVKMIDTCETAAAKGRLSTVLSRVVPAWAGRLDSEHEQAVIRLLIGAAASMFLLIISCSDIVSIEASFYTEIGITIF